MEDKKIEIEVTVDETKENGEKNEETYRVEMIDADKDKKQPCGVLALLSLIFALVSLSGALLNVVLALLTVAATFILEIMPFIHAFLCLPALLFAILAIVFSRIAKKKGNKSLKGKLGLTFGLISTVVLALSIVGMTIFGIIALSLAIILGVASVLLSSALVTLSTALAPILAILGELLLLISPILIGAFADAFAAEIVELIMEFLQSLVVSGVIFLPLI